jgi:putative ABC transport system permease protein
MSVLERRREVGVLRAIGTRRRAVAGMVLVEATTLTAVAYVLALPLGGLLGRYLTASLGDSFGFNARPIFPWSTVEWLLVVGAVVALLAAVVPARRAAVIDPVAALRAE